MRTRSIRRLLVANRGEIARRIMRTARAMGIATVAVYSDPDARGAHVREADRAVALGGTTATESYLSIERILAAARRSGADAVHPGYGFLSESADFARVVLDAGLTWVGPPPDVIAVMGDKLAALELMHKAGVPTLPRVDVAALGDDALPKAAGELGYPLLVKAANGGGGKGMRIVLAAAGLVDAVAAARRESARAFGSDVVFLERYVSPARHIEVQILADEHGSVCHLFERECSIQRRHQKIIEESPSPFLSPDLRQRLCAAAVAAAGSVGYRNAGTVEFVVDSAGGFYFLEMNTRLQVEHPVTECVSGLDLVRLQLLVAQGLPLNLADARQSGAAIEARVYAEDPARDFLPASGRIALWSEPDGVRVDAGVQTGDEVSVHYDPLLAKVIAHAPTREEAASVLRGALSRLRVHGPATNRQFLVNVLGHPAFLAGRTTTDFVERHASDLLQSPDREAAREAAILAALAARERRVAADPDRLPVPPGWRNNRGAGERTTYDGGFEVEFWPERDGTIVGTCATGFSARVWAWSDPEIDAEIDGVRRRATVTTDGATVWVQDDATEVRLTEQPRFPGVQAGAVDGGLIAPMNGTVVSVEVAVGDPVVSGQTLAVVEAMKMEHRVRATDGGTVAEVLAKPGQSVSAEQLLFRIT